MAKVFISHATADRAFVESQLIPLLEGHAIETWYSSEDIGSATLWERTIRDALNACDWFLVVMTPSALRSPWVRAEVHWAMDKRRDRFIPLLAEECDWEDLHLMMRTIQNVRFCDGGREARRRLLAVWGIEPRESVDVIQSHELARLEGRIQDLRYGHSYDHFWISSPLQAVQVECRPMGDPGLQRVVPMREPVNLQTLLARFLEQVDADDSPVPNCTFGGGNRIIFALPSGNLVSAGIGAVREERVESFDYHRTGLPAGPGCAASGPSLEIMVGYPDGALYVWKYGSHVPHRVESNGPPVVALGSSASSMMVSARADGTITIWSTVDHRAMKSFRGTEARLTSLDVCLASRLLATADDDGRINTWNYDGTCLRSFGGAGPVSVMRFLDSSSSDEHSCLAAAGKVSIDVWNYQQGTVLWTIQNAGGTPQKLAFERTMASWSSRFSRSRLADRCTTWLAAGYDDGRVLAWKLEL